VVSCPNDLICLVVKYECSHSSFTRVKLCLCKIVFRISKLGLELKLVIAVVVVVVVVVVIVLFPPFAVVVVVAA
jgi:hypothetical protein